MNTQFFITEATSATGEVVSQIFMKTEDGALWSLPQDESNADRQRFMQWCQMGNTPQQLVVEEQEVIEDGN